MDIIDRLINGLYEQSFYNGTIINPTRFFILHYISCLSNLVPCFNLSDVSYYVYCLYADNPEIAVRHPNVEIRNILKYGSSPVKDEVVQAIKNWNDDTDSLVISCDTRHIRLHYLDEEFSNDLAYLQTVIEEHFKNTFHISFPKKLCACGNDNDITVFGKSSFRNHVLFDMQYCVCCDACNLNDLVAVHILQDDESENVDSREDKNNGLIMCSLHAEEYLHKRFSFDDKGKMINHSSSFVQKNMRLGIGILSAKRREYLVAKNKNGDH